MKKSVLILTLLLFYFSPQAQKMKDNNLSKRINEIEDRIALKNLVDTFSILADVKETQKQTLLFTDNATVETYINGQQVANLKGRKEIGDAFANFLKMFETVYHINGQQSVTINGDKASGISYCMVTLIAVENGKKMKTSIGIYYNDEFAREGGHWLIAKRKSIFTWQDKQELGQ